MRPELDVADDVVDREQADALVDAVGRLLRDVARQVRAFVCVAADERVHDVAVGRDRRQLDLAEIVLERRAARRLPRPRVRRPRGTPSAGVGDAERDVLHAVAVRGSVLADRRAAAKSARDDEADLVLFEHVARAVADARLGPCVRRPPEAERVLVVVGGLLRVPDPELDVVPAVERHEVRRHGSESIPAVAGVPAAASAAETSSRERRRCCSWT